MFETIESYKSDKQNKLNKELEENNYPEECRLNCAIHAKKIQGFENKIEEIAEDMHEISKSMKNIANGISNTVDSHRIEITDLNTRLTRVEQTAESTVESRNVLLGLMAGVFLIIVAIFYDYFTFKKDILIEFKNVITKE
jgi:predicted RNase H-like nuclease (RuvC/YqgF family)